MKKSNVTCDWQGKTMEKVNQRVFANYEAHMAQATKSIYFFSKQTYCEFVTLGKVLRNKSASLATTWPPRRMSRNVLYSWVHGEGLIPHRFE